jgi:hypothetical protein
MQSKITYSGRPDGLGNRIEEIILLNGHCIRLNTNAIYLWNNRLEHRSYPIRIKASNVDITELFNIENKESNNIVLPRLTKKEIQNAAINISPNFNICFDHSIEPVGIHIRGTDRIRNYGHPHYMSNHNELHVYVARTIRMINSQKPKAVFICSDDPYYKKFFIRHLSKKINIVEPLVAGDIENEYLDLFALTLCSAIYMCSKFSSFAITASILGNNELYMLREDLDVVNRYKANFNVLTDLRVSIPAYLELRLNHYLKKIYSKTKRLIKKKFNITK